MRVRRPETQAARCVQRLGPPVDPMYAGQMGPEAIHFLESVLLETDPIASPEHARMVMESYLAVDISAETGDPVELSLSNHSLALLADMIAAIRSDAA
ncbi:hypothetical protein [Pseudorhodobacter aquimaris]|uniref:hypothetical protein n=1 Tax=Pseudorhodobacter aquimaris TaxID=687412 RepID=UPI000ADBC5D2|nr:hypothetical protein [Pseudorhodobacter aquimaris]